MGNVNLLLLEVKTRMLVLTLNGVILHYGEAEHGTYNSAPLCPPQVVNKPDSHGGSLDWTKICEKSSKVITFIDLAGHEKYLKTTVFGMTGHLPDFCMLMVRERTGLSIS